MSTKVTPYIVVPDCNAAIEFYQKAFGAEETSARILDENNRVGHAMFDIGESTIHISDEHPELDILAPGTIGNSPVRLMLQVDDVDTTFKLALDLGAKELIPVADQFYGERSGRLMDPSGHTWILSTTIEDLSDDELSERASGKYHVEEAE